jgi:thiamine-phosphate pyrophosphorylase
MRPSFDAALEAALRGGARFIQLREKDLSPREVLDLALHAQRLCEKYGAKLVINSRADIARAAHADGVHLPENDVPPAAARLSLGYHALCGVSVHSVEAARLAAHEGADYLVFGPVFQTTSHPGTAPVGLEALREIATAVTTPIFAIGGIDTESSRLCLNAGAYGVAVISAVWHAANVVEAVRNFTNASLLIPDS